MENVESARKYREYNHPQSCDSEMSVYTSLCFLQLCPRADIHTFTRFTVYHMGGFAAYIYFSLWIMNILPCCQIFSRYDVSVFLIYYIFNWRIIALWRCVGFCCTSAWVSHRCPCVPSLTGLPPPPSPATLQAVTEHHSEFPGSHGTFPPLCILHMMMHAFQCCSLRPAQPLLPPLCPRSVLCVCVSAAALWMGSSGPSFSVQFSHSGVSNTVQPHGLQASLSFTNSWSLLQLMPIKSERTSNHLILCHPLLPSIFPSGRVFQMSQFFASVGQMQPQHQSFQWIFRTDLL